MIPNYFNYNVYEEGISFDTANNVRHPVVALCRT